MRKAVVLPLLALPLACADSPVQPTPELAMLETRVAGESSMGPWMEAITGSGHFVATSYYAPYPVWRTFTIEAQKKLNGMVEGKFQIILHLKDGVHVAKGEVVCFTVSGNTAWIGAYKEGNSPPDIAFQVVDNGEGHGASPDEVGLYAEASYWGLPAGMAQSFCDETPDFWSIPGLGDVSLAFFRHPIEAGNIQIKTR